MNNNRIKPHSHTRTQAKRTNSKKLNTNFISSMGVHMWVELAGRSCRGGCLLRVLERETHRVLAGVRELCVYPKRPHDHYYRHKHAHWVTRTTNSFGGLIAIMHQFDRSRTCVSCGRFAAFKSEYWRWKWFILPVLREENFLVFPKETRIFSRCPAHLHDNQLSNGSIFLGNTSVVQTDIIQRANHSQLFHQITKLIPHFPLGMISRLLLLPLPLPLLLTMALTLNYANQKNACIVIYRHFGVSARFVILLLAAC